MNHAPASEVDTKLIPVENLETIRNRLNQVHLSLRKLSDQIAHHNRYPNKVKFPNYTHIQNQFRVLLTQLHTITSNLENSGDTLKNTNVYPLPSFPTTQQEGLVTTLLRKKPLPEVDEWIAEALEKVSKGCNSVSKDDEFTHWCTAKIEELKEEFQFYGFDSIEEMRFAETEEGKQKAAELRRLEKENDAIEAKITNGGKEGLHPNSVLKFMCQGAL